MAEARAVRKAVNVEAWRMPTGWPVSEKTVMAPVGLILGFPVASSFSDRGGESVMTILVVVSLVFRVVSTGIKRTYLLLRHRQGCSRA